MNYIKMIFELWQLKRNERKTAEEISSLQAKKRKRLLHYAYEHSAYYRNSFERADITTEMIDSTPLPTRNCLETKTILFIPPAAQGHPNILSMMRVLGTVCCSVL